MQQVRQREKNSKWTVKSTCCITWYGGTTDHRGQSLMITDCVLVIFLFLCLFTFLVTDLYGQSPVWYVELELGMGMGMTLKIKWFKSFQLIKQIWSTRYN